MNILNLLSNNTNLTYIVIGLMIIVIILFIMILILIKWINLLEKKYKRFMRGTTNKNLEGLIIDYLDKIDMVNKNNESMLKEFKKYDERIKGCIQKTSIVRYKAFDDVGSDLSFSIAFLNEENTGVIMTGIFGRNESTTYAKPIDKGISRYDLSDEEKQVLNDAMNKKIG